MISVINYKGSVGKTTLTANIGVELARRGRQVLLIDLDPQASLTFSFYRRGIGSSVSPTTARSCSGSARC